MNLSEPEPGRYHINDRVRMFGLLDPLKEMGIESVDIDLTERDQEVRRKPALGFDRKHRRLVVPDIFKQRKRMQVLVRVEVVIDDKALFGQGKTMHGRVFCGVESKRRRSDDDKDGEEVAPEKECRDRECYGDDADRPVPVGTLGVVLIFAPLPFESRALHTSIIHRLSKRAR